MAQGDFLKFHALGGYIRGSVVDLLTGTPRIILCSDPVTALLVTETNPAKGSANINEVNNGGGYTAGGIALTMDSTDVAGLFTYKVNTTTHPSGQIAWAKAAGSPTNIKSAVLIDDDAVSPVDAAIGFWDMTEDGGATAVSLVARDIELNLGANGGNPGEIFTWDITA